MKSTTFLQQADDLRPDVRQQIEQSIAAGVACIAPTASSRAWRYDEILAVRFPGWDADQRLAIAVGLADADRDDVAIFSWALERMAQGHDPFHVVETVEQIDRGEIVIPSAVQGAVGCWRHYTDEIGYCVTHNRQCFAEPN